MTQREIKFRVWDKIYNRWLDLWQLAFASEGKLMALCDLDSELYGLHQVALMQYTGLKDKNGKEIYESDRVKTPAGVGVVRWDRCFRLFWNERDSTTLHNVQEEQLEVIGNIYEP